jgi:hypothetical protein
MQPHGYIHGARFDMAPQRRFIGSVAVFEDEIYFRPGVFEDLIEHTVLEVIERCPGRPRFAGIVVRGHSRMLAPGARISSC